MKRAVFARTLGAAAATCLAGADSPASGRTQIAWYAAELHGARTVISQDANTVFPAASIIKLLIARTLVELVARGELDEDARIPLRAIDRVGGSDRFGDAAPGRYPLDALLGAMLSLSDNTAANALLRASEMERCNREAAALGLAATRIRRTFYDWAARSRGIDNTTTPLESARTIVDLAGCAAAPGPRRRIARVVMRALLAQEDRETIPPEILRRARVANKTGELPGIRSDVAIVDYGAPSAYVVAVMSSYAGGPRRDAIAAVRSTMRSIDGRIRRVSVHAAGRAHA